MESFNDLISVDVSRVPTSPSPVLLGGREFLHYNSYFLYVEEKPAGFRETQRYALPSTLRWKEAPLITASELIYQRYGLDRFYLPFVCIIEFEGDECKFFLHQSKSDPALDGSDKQQEALSSSLKALYHKVKLLYDMEYNRSRMQRIVDSHEMMQETIISSNRCSLQRVT